MKTFITLSMIAFVLFHLNGQNTVSLSDFELVNNTSWSGTLTYLDFQTGKHVDIDATAQIKIENERIVTSIQYTYEPNKNYTSKVKIKNNGRLFGSEEVIENTVTDGTRKLITLYEGKDNERKAKIYKSYIFNTDEFTISKKVVYEDNGKELIRNTYKFKKVN